MRMIFWRQDLLVKRLAVVLVLASVLLSGCRAQVGAEATASACARGLKQATAELDLAKAKGFGGTVAWSKAAGLIARAKIHQQFERYRKCTNETERARFYIRQSKQ